MKKKDNPDLNEKRHSADPILEINQMLNYPTLSQIIKDLKAAVVKHVSSINYKFSGNK